MKKGFIRTRMYQLGLNQKKLADMSDIHEITLSHLMNGKYDPSVKTLNQLAIGLKCKPGDLLETSTPEELKKGLENANE